MTRHDGARKLSVGWNRTGLTSAGRRLARFALAATLSVSILGQSATAQITILDPAVEAQNAFDKGASTLGQLYAGLAAVERRLDKSVFEVSTLAARLASTDSAFQYVRDKIGFEPYWGELRGAQGTLLARSGNALDRSLLLAALLEAMGTEVRIARGSLGPDLAAQLGARAVVARPAAPDAAPITPALVAEIATAAGMSQSSLADEQQHLSAATDAADSALTATLGRQSGPLLQAVHSAGIPAGSVTTSTELAADASDHFWVQVHTESGAWTDLDPAFPDATPGRAYANMQSSFAPDDVPSFLLHQMRVQLVLSVAHPDQGGGNRGTGLPY